MNRFLHALVLLAPVFCCNVAGAQELEKAEFKPYLFTGFTTDVPATHNYGGFHYTTIHNITKDDEVGDFFTSGMIHTWYRPTLITGADDYTLATHGYHTMEGGVGYKPYYRFHNPKMPHKFTMGGVSAGFDSFSNGPGSGPPGMNNSENATYKNWDTNRGRYGAAILSNRFLFPLDGIGFKEGSNNKMFGYGYYPLPLTEPKSTTAGQDVPTGNHNWTVFINTQNFSGPVAFHPPYHWSRRALDNELIVGSTFDHSLLSLHSGIQRETGNLPAKKWTDSNGDAYYKISAAYMPTDDDGIGRLAGNVMTMDSTMWDNLNNWFNGGAVASQDFNASPGAIHLRQNTSGTPRYRLDGDVEITELDFMQRVADPTSEYNLAYQWGDLTTMVPGEELIQLPEYYVLRSGASAAVAIPESEVPTESGLQAIEGKAPHVDDWEYTNTRFDPNPVITPVHPDFPDIQGDELLSAWTSPGPVAGPYNVELEDGSTVVYYWYKFNEQPYILNNDMDDAERELIQQRVELIHANWTIDNSAYVPEATKELASVDEGLIVTPPQGLETGYVAVPVHQQLSTEPLPVFPTINRIEIAPDCSIGTLCNPDSDGDGLSDSTEINTSNTDPNNPDSDGDGLTDGAEVNVYNTNPNNADTDDDGLSDGDEVNADTDPNNADSDGDGLSDGDEVNDGTNPNNADSDGDGLSDGDEVNADTDPNNADSDGDGLSDGDEVNDGTNPNNADSDGDGLSDGDEVNADTNPNNADSDGDGLSDGDEVNAGTNPNNADSDGDGLSDGDEVNAGTDPNNADSDGDGLSDGDEVNAGTNPNSDNEVTPEEPDGPTKGLVTGSGCALHPTGRSPVDPMLPLVLALSVLACHRRRRTH